MKGFKTLKELGLKDKRFKIPEETRNALIRYIELNNTSSLRSIAKKFGVSLTTVYSLKNKERYKELIKNSLDRLGGYNHYRDKEKQKEWQKDCTMRKMERIKELGI